MKHTALKIASAIFVSSFIFSSVHAEETEEFSYGLKTDKLIIPMEETTSPMQAMPQFNAFPMYPSFSAFSIPMIPQNHFTGFFHAGYAPMAMVSYNFVGGFRHF